MSKIKMSSENRRGMHRLEATLDLAGTGNVDICASDGAPGRRWRRSAGLQQLRMPAREVLFIVHGGADAC